VAPALPALVPETHFRSRLVRPEGVGTWTFALVSATAVREGALRARMRVRGTVDGAPFRSSLMPRGGGTLFIVVPRELRERIGKTAGQSVEVALAPETQVLVLRVPPDLRQALGSDRAKFDRLAPSHRKAFLQWIADAKHSDTRVRRVAQAAEMVRAGKTRN
jgi:bifunctional DNA-binding transcriptional regulator/antitoxin component of YhaV-PrlF toxin-antitoxin module